MNIKSNDYNKKKKIQKFETPYNRKQKNSFIKESLYFALKKEVYT